MTEWIVPLAGMLIFLLLCPGCMLWVWQHNRKAVSEHLELTAQEDELQGLAGGAA